MRSGRPFGRARLAGEAPITPALGQRGSPIGRGHRSPVGSWPDAATLVVGERVDGTYTLRAVATTDLLERAKRRLDSLSPERLRAAEDFLAYLEERETDEATEEILRLPDILAALEKAENEIREGRLTPVEQLRRKA